MAISNRNRYRSNIILICVVAIFCVAGFAVSRTVSSSNGKSGSAPDLITTPGTIKPRPGSIKSGEKNVKPMSPQAERGELVFSIGGFAGSLYRVINVGTQNDVEGLTFTVERTPVFSPDGNKIIFTSYRDGDRGSGYQEIYSMNPNGYDQTRLTTEDCNLAEYAVSPDSSKIAYVCGGNLSTMNIDGSGKSQIADFDSQITEPQYSPDGTKIIFIYQGTIWRIDADGANGAELGNLGGKERARYSPDGTKIVFSAASEIYTMDADGTNEAKIIDNEPVGYDLDRPEFSPDGTKLLMECRGAGVNYCTSDADGSNFAPLGGTILERSYAAWSPDSSSVAFIARNSANNVYGVYTTTLGGQPQAVYLENPGTPIDHLAWQPECPASPTPTPTPTPTPAGTPIPGLISEWNANGLNADDSQGLNNGQFVDNSALTVLGKRGYGFYFSGDGGYISVPDSNSLDVQTGDYTLSTWFDPAAAAEHYVAGKGACNGGGSNFYIGVDANFNPFIDISHSSGGSRVGSNGFALSQNVWHNLLLRKEGTLFTLYVDGVLAITHTETGTMDTSDQPFTFGKGIGCTPPQLTTNGGVDEVLLFGRALNALEIDAIYNGYVPPTGATPTPTPANNGLVGFWRANDSAADSSGSNNGTLVGNTHYSTGHQGNAFDFDGAGDRVIVPDNGNDLLDLQTGDFTVAAWVNIRSSGTYFIAGKEFDGDSYALKVQGQALYFYLLKDSTFQYINTGDDLTFNTWHHVAGVRSNGMIRVFVDGTERSSTTFTDTLAANTTDFTIGGPVYSTTPQPDTNGLIDDVRLYNRGVDGPEMLSIFNDTGFAGRRQVAVRQGLVCQPPADPSVQMRVNYPNPVAAGRPTTINLRLKDYAPAGGTLVNLTYSNSGVLTGPASYTVSEGNNEANIEVTSTAGTTFRSSDVTATLGAESARVTVTVSPAAPEVAVSNLIAPSDVDILADFTATWTVTNNGQAPTNSYRQDTFYLSNDNILFNDLNDHVVGRSYDNNGILAPGQSKNMTLGTINIPAAYIPTDGTYYLFVLIGDAGTVQESNGNFGDNYMSMPIVVHRNLPDLVALNVQGPPEIEPNVVYTVTWDVKNAGNRAITAGSNHYVYFSYDNIIGNADDVTLTGRRIGALAANEVQSFSQLFILPTVPVKPSSDSLFYVKVDQANEIYEDIPGGPAEANNTTSTPVRFEYRVPDLQVPTVTPPTEVESDTVFDLAWTSKNFGGKAVGGFNERVYFSTDAVASGNDIEIGNFPLAQTLGPDQSIDRIQNVSIPTNAVPATGNYYIYVRTDADAQIDEGANENNNVTFHPLRVRRLLRPDLQVTNIVAPASAFFDQQVQVQWTVTNAGTGPTNAANWQDELYLATNAVLQNPTLLSRTSNASSLNPGESYIVTATVRVPRGLNGSYFFVIKTDSGSTVNEENETNNLGSKAITLNIPPLPDVRVSAVQAPEESFGGQSISVSWTVTNNGTGATPTAEFAWSDAIFISRDATFSNDDRYVGIRSRSGALPANGSYTVSDFNVTLPGDAFGDYYVFVVADYYGQLYEFTSEGNNSDYDRIAPGSPMHVLGTPPDLAIPFALTATPTIIAGQSTNVQFTVKNQGAFDASGTWTDAVYISADQTFDPAGDQLIGSLNHVGLAAGQQYGVNAAVTIPNCLNGRYYLYGVTDVGNRIFEFDANGDAESNNISQPKAIDISSFAPDLQVTQITVPPVVINGSMPMSWTIKNFGTADATQVSWYDQVYIVANNQFINLGSFEHRGGLPVGGEYSQNQVVHIPDTLEGEFQIIVRADTFNTVSECSYEQNNDNSGTTQVGQDLPDLRTTGITAPASAPIGSSFNVSWAGGNFSSAMDRPGSWADTVYLSNDANFNLADTPIGGTVISSQLGAGQTYNGGANVTIPNVAPGNYFLIVNADNGNNVAEGVNEGNNALIARPITLTAPAVDLVVTGTSTNPTLYSGQVANVTWTVTNAGTDPTVASDWMDHVYLSRDLNIDPSDRLLDYRPHSGALAGGGSYSFTGQVVIPSGLTGEYKMIVVTDRNRNVAESNEDNNIGAAFTVDIQLPPPAEFNITNVTPPASVTPGDETTFTWTVQNSSVNAVSGSWQDSVYLSTDQTWDSGDVLVGQSVRTGDLGAFATYTQTLTTAMPPVELGSYYVIVRTDARNTVRESDETNNVTSSILQTSVTIPTLTLGNALTTSLVTAQERYYSILNVPADETMLVSIDGETGSRNELYSRFGSVVSRSNYEVQGARQGFPDQENVVPSTTAGTYYTMARGDYVPASFAGALKKADERKAKETAAAQAVILKAELLPFGIRAVSPGDAGNKGYAFLSIDGAKFQEGATVKMVGPGGVELTPLKTFVTDKSNVKALFNFFDKPVGDYQVSLTNPNSQTAVWSSMFHIRSGGGHQISSEVTGAGEVRPGRFYRYTVTTRNQGMNDALSVPIVVILSQQLNYKLSTSNQINVESEGVDQSTVAKHFDKDGKRFIFLFAPVVRSRESVNIGIDVEFGGAATITATTLPPMFAPGFVPGSPFRSLAGGNPNSGGDILLCYIDLLVKGLLLALNEILPVECASAVASNMVSLLETMFANIRSGFDAYGTMGSVAQAALNVALDCAKNLGKYVPWLKLLSVLYDIYQLSTLALECVQKTVEFVFNVNLSRSIDPNEKLGPIGYGPERWVPTDKPLIYRINFENKAEATAPAQRIRITDQLPATLDPRTVRLIEMGFDHYRVEVPGERAFYQTRLQLGADRGGLKADVSGGLDITTGRVTWTMTAVDPETNERPLNPQAGILPPNNAQQDGEGYVIFSVKPLATAPTRTELANTASIVFDENEPIVTNTTSNLLDADIPVSQCSALPATVSDPAIQLSWGGSDDANGSGLKSFDVFASENGGAYLPVIFGATGTSGIFNGKYGRSYRFYSVATDNAGNVEAAPASQDASVTVLGGAFEGDVATRPSGNNDGTVDDQDVAQIRRFAAKLDTDFQYNEFQRADTAPGASGGDGVLSISDVMQARRYSLGLDPVAESNGPLAASGLGGKPVDGKSAGLLPRGLTPVFVSRTLNKVVIGVRLEAQGDETGAGFTLNYDTAQIANPANITLGTDAAGGSVTANTAVAGKVGVMVDRAPTQPFAAGSREIVRIEFDVVNLSAAQTLITFGSDPVKTEVVSGSAAELTSAFTDTNVTLFAPTAAGVTVSGRVTDVSGRPVANTTISISDDRGTVKRALSNAFGYYTLEDIEVGRSYVVSASHKTRQFARPSVIITLEDAVSDLNFVAGN